MTAGLEPRGGKAAKGGAAAHGANGGTGPPVGDGQGSAAGVLADRMAAALVHREPGWKLPRRSALARRFNVSLADIDVAVEELSRRALLRKLPDGQLYRASPAEYQIPIEGVSGLSTTVDPMGSVIVCQARHVSRRPAPQDICWALGLAPGTQVRVIRCLWTSGGRPVAMSTAYQPPRPAARQPVTTRVRGPRDDDEDPGWLPAFEELLSAPPAEFTEPPADGGPASPQPGRPGRPGRRRAPGHAERGAEPAAALDRAGPAPGSRPVGDHRDHQVRRVVGSGCPDRRYAAAGLLQGLRRDGGAGKLTVVMLRPDFFKVSVETAAPES